METTRTFSKILEAVADDRYRIIGAVSGTRTGKSYSMAQLAVLKALNTPYFTVTYIAPNIPHLRLGVWKDLTSIINSEKLGGFCQINLSTFTIKFSNGSIIQATSFMDKGAELAKGVATDWAVFEEILESADWEIFSQINSRCRGKILFNFNPSCSRNNWVEKYVFSQPNCKRIHLTIDDNRFLSDEQKQEIYRLAELDARYKQIYLVGDYYSMSEKQIITNYQTLPHADFLEAWQKGTRFYGGLDFGYINSVNALVITTMIGGNIYVKTLMYQNQLLNNEIAERILNSECADKCPYNIVADSAEMKSIDEINKFSNGRLHLVGASKGKNSVLEGINSIKKFKLVIDSTDSLLIRDIESYEWLQDKSTNELVNTPNKQGYDAHLIDAISYCVRTYYNQPTKNKSRVC